MNKASCKTRLKSSPLPHCFLLQWSAVHMNIVYAHKYVALLHAYAELIRERRFPRSFSSPSSHQQHYLIAPPIALVWEPWPSLHGIKAGMHSATKGSEGVLIPRQRYKSCHCRRPRRKRMAASPCLEERERKERGEKSKGRKMTEKSWKGMEDSERTRAGGFFCCYRESGRERDGKLGNKKNRSSTELEVNLGWMGGYAQGAVIHKQTSQNCPAGGRSNTSTKPGAETLRS